MNVEAAVDYYKKNIEKLAEKNNVDVDVMVDNWKQKFEEFEAITDDHGFTDREEALEKDEQKPFAGLTINGSIISN